MTMTITSPVTGSTQTGLTAPTYTLVSDVFPDVNGKQQAVTVLGGTQTGVLPHGVSSPFTISVVKPKTSKTLKPIAVGGQLLNVPRNTYKVIVRKGVLPLAGQPYQVMNITCTIDVPAGADSADPANIRAALSLLIGGLSQISAGIGDTCVTGAF